MQRIVVIDTSETRRSTLATLLEDAITGVRVDSASSLADAGSLGYPDAIVLNSLVPGSRGELPDAIRNELNRVRFAGPGLAVVCSAFLLDPVFASGVQSLKGPQSLVSIPRTGLDWVGRVVAALENHLGRTGLGSLWNGFFPGGSGGGAGPSLRLDPSTHLVLLKRSLRASNDRENPPVPVQQRFCVRFEHELERDGYSLW